MRRPLKLLIGCGAIALAAVLLWQHHRSTVTIYVMRLPSGPLFVSEDPKYPALQKLRKAENIDQVIHGAQTDMEQLLRLSQWSAKLFPATTPFPNYPPWDGAEILKRIRTKQSGGFCAQYGYIFGQVCQSLGYNIRYVGILNRQASSGHALLEVYVPSLSRWVIFEPEFGRYYTDSKGRPLGAWELHRYAVGEQKGTVLEYPSRQPIAKDWLNLFYNFKYTLRNNFLSVPVYHFYQPKRGGQELIFERYQLRWMDRFTKHTPEALLSLTSSRKEDFEFNMDLSQTAVTRRCRTLQEFASFIQQVKPLQLYRVRLPHTLLTTVIEQVFINDARFKPLT